MSAQTAPTPTPAAPAAPAPSAPAAPAKLTNDQKYAAALKESGVDTSDVPRETPPTAPTAVEKRLLKLKIDGREEDFDVDETWKDEKRREDMKNWIQRGRNADREVARTRDTTAETWRKFIDKQNFKIEKDPTDTEFGWKLVPKSPVTTPGQPVTTPAQDADPLTTEERTLSAKFQAGEASYADVDRLTQIRSELAVKRALAEIDGRGAKAKAEADAKQAAATREETTKTWFNGEIDKAVEPYTKALEGRPDKDKILARWRKVGFDVGNSAAGRQEHPVEAMRAYIADEAAALSFAAPTQRPAAPAPAPIVGVGAAGATKRKLTDDEKYAAAMAEVFPGK